MELTTGTPLREPGGQQQTPLVAVLVSLLVHVGLIAGGTLLNEVRQSSIRLEYEEGIPVEVIVDRSGEDARAARELRVPDIAASPLTAVPPDGATSLETATALETLTASAPLIVLRPLESSLDPRAEARSDLPPAALVQAHPADLAASPAADELHPVRDPPQVAIARHVPVPPAKPVAPSETTAAPHAPVPPAMPVAPSQSSHLVEGVQDRTGLAPVAALRTEIGPIPPSLPAKTNLGMPEVPASSAAAPQTVLRRLDALEAIPGLAHAGNEASALRDVQPAPSVAAVAPEAAAVALPEAGGGPGLLLSHIAPVQHAQNPSTDPLEPKLMAALPPVQGVQSFDPQKEIETTLGAFECARISARWDAGNGELAVSGHVRSEADRHKLVEVVLRVPGVERVDAAGVRVVGEPYCRLVAFLSRAELNRSEDQRHDMAVLGTAAQAGISHYSAGTALQLTLAAPEFDSYIYVDYFSSDGRVYHLLPTEKPDNRFTADERVSVGGDHGRGRRAVVGAPFGLDVVVAIASSEALFVRPRPPAEAAADYLAALDARIRQLRESGLKPRLEYAYYLTYTTPAGGPSN